MRTLRLDRAGRSAHYVAHPVDRPSQATARVWDLARRSLAPAGTLATGRSHHTATLLPDGRVLVIGGMDADIEFIATAEVWTPRG